MKNKNNVRYVGFRAAADGGRFFDFSISSSEQADVLTSFEIPGPLFAGPNRIRLQEGVGICYAKLKYLLEEGVSNETPTHEIPTHVLLTASDVAQYREILPSATRRAPTTFDETKV